MKSGHKIFVLTTGGRFYKHHLVAVMLEVEFIHKDAGASVSRMFICPESPEPENNNTVY